VFAPSMSYNQSHRHFSHQMAIHPLGLIKWEDGIASQKIIQNTIRQMDSIGPGRWCGYSYSWLGNIKARARDGDGAAKDLQIFSSAFCLKNSFHVNGDQTKSGLSGFTYRPFTLEGNFAFASGIQEMLIQSYSGNIVLFPAIPAAWKDVHFTTLRTEGAFLVSGTMKDGKVISVTVLSEQGGVVRIQNPFEGNGFTIFHASTSGKNGFETISRLAKDEVIKINLKKGEKVVLALDRKK
jgi:alpha-L-fucosidase 2